jgi:hypothetical protein
MGCAGTRPSRESFSKYFRVIDRNAEATVASTKYSSCAFWTAGLSESDWDGCFLDTRHHWHWKSPNGRYLHLFASF